MLAEARRSKLIGRVRIMMRRQGQEQGTLTAAQPVNPVTEGIRSPEVRWIFLRAGAALEVKAYQESPGILDIAGCARGRMESWRKWSFPSGSPSHGRAGVRRDPAG